MRPSVCYRAVTALVKQIWRRRPFRRLAVSTWCTLPLHENARPHTIVRTTEAVANFGCTRLPHPPYSLGLAPSDYHLFGPLKTKQDKETKIERNPAKTSTRQWRGTA